VADTVWNSAFNEFWESTYVRERARYNEATCDSSEDLEGPEEAQEQKIALRLKKKNPLQNQIVKRKTPDADSSEDSDSSSSSPPSGSSSPQACEENSEDGTLTEIPIQTWSSPEAFAPESLTRKLRSQQGKSELARTCPDWGRQTNHRVFMGIIIHLLGQAPEG
jgi:hypothetical protein